MARLAPAFSAALVLHLLLLWIPLPDNEPKPRPISREVTIKLTSSMRQAEAEPEPQPEKKETRQKIPERQSPKIIRPTETEKEKTGQKRRVKKLSPVRFKKKFVKIPEEKKPEPEPLVTRKNPIPSREPDPPAPQRPENNINDQPAQKKRTVRAVTADKATKETEPDHSAIRENNLTNTSQPVIRKASPLYRKNPPPTYPIVAKRRGRQGRVILAVEVNREGRVNKARVKQSSGFAILDEAALDAVKGWLFSPGQRNGKAVAMEVEIPVNFKLR